MRITSLLLLLAGACPGAQVIMSGTASMGESSHFRFETRVEPEIAGQKLSGFGAGGVIVDKGGFHRYMTDPAAKRYFGYDMSIETEPGGLFRVTFQPLTLSAEKLRLKPPEAWDQIPLPRLPAPQVVRKEDTMALDLFVNPTTGQKIVDYLTFDEGRPVVRLPEGEARDYTVDDAPLTLGNMRLSLNGKQIHKLGGSVSGESVSFYLPDYGRYTFSLAPHEQLGFVKAGEVRGNQLTITWGSNAFTLDCDGPIAPGGGTFNLYVGWRPANGGGFHLSAQSGRRRN